jgi:hypothetical protein
VFITAHNFNDFGIVEVEWVINDLQNKFSIDVKNSPIQLGSRHPISLVKNQIIEVFNQSKPKTYCKTIRSSWV